MGMKEKGALCGAPFFFRGEFVARLTSVHATFATERNVTQRFSQRTLAAQIERQDASKLVVFVFYSVTSPRENAQWCSPAELEHKENCRCLGLGGNRARKRTLRNVPFRCERCVNQSQLSSEHESRRKTKNSGRYSSLTDLDNLLLHYLH
jgi:hypothetical protein